MNIFMPKNLRFLHEINSRIKNLPEEIWNDKDISSPNYDIKRKKLIGEVMHIRNKISGYIIARYGEGDLIKEFCDYSFFTRGNITNTFNIANNEAWAKGKHSYLYFVEKLIDFAESEEIINSKNWWIDIAKWFVLFVILGVAVIFLFSEIRFSDHFDIVVNMPIKSKFQILLLVTLITSNCLWYKNWRDILPLTTSVGGTILGMQF